jgi:cardiolipin synthase
MRGRALTWGDRMGFMKRFIIQSLVIGTVLTQGNLSHSMADERSLALSSPTADDFFQSRLGTPLVSGNRAELLIEGTEFYPRRLEMIRSAQHTIDISTFLWCDDEAGLTVARELVQAIKRGVRVRPIVDFFNIYPHEQVYGMLQSAGSPVLIYNPPEWGLDRIYEHSLHEKVMIVDGRRVLTGGANLCNEYMVGGERKLWRDLEVYFEGPLSSVVQTRFDQTWNWMAKTDYSVRKMATRRAADPTGMAFPIKKYKIYLEKTPSDARVAGNDKGLFFQQQSYRDRSQGQMLKAALVDLLDKAKSDIRIYTPYYIPPRAIEDALIRAVSRGVKVTVITNSAETNDADPAKYAALSHYRKSINGGVELREYQSRMMHVKGVMIDQELLFLGSHNLTHRSFNVNGEVGVFFDNSEMLSRFSKAWEEDLLHSHPISHIELEKLQGSISGVLKSLLFGLFEGEI